MYPTDLMLAAKNNLRGGGWLVFAAGLILSACLLQAADSTNKIGDTINFSDPGSRLIPPPTFDDGQDKTFDFLKGRGNSMSPVFQGPGSGASVSLPNSRRSLKQLEKADQDRNWIFKDSKASTNPDLKEMMGVEDTSIGKSRKPKRAIEQYIDRMDKESKSSRTNDSPSDFLSKDDKSRDPYDMKLGNFGSMEGKTKNPIGKWVDPSAKNGVLGDESDPGALDKVGAFSTMNDLFNPNVNAAESRKSRAEMDTKMQDFQKLLQPSSGNLNSSASLNTGLPGAFGPSSLGSAGLGGDSSGGFRLGDTLGGGSKVGGNLIISEMSGSKLGGSDSSFKPSLGSGSFSSPFSTPAPARTDYGSGYSRPVPNALPFQNALPARKF